MAKGKSLKLRAEECIKKHNYGYAQQIYQSILELDSTDLEIRTKLRAVNLKMLEENNGKVSAFKTAPLNIKISLAGKKYEKVINLTEKFLGFDPKNVSMLMKQGEAFLETDDIPSAIFIFETANKLDNKNTEPLKNLCNLFIEKSSKEKDNNSKREALQQAVDYADALIKVDPKDKKLAEFQKDISAKLAAIPFSGDDFMEGVRDSDESEKREKDDNLIHSDDEAYDAITRVKENIEKEPQNPALYDKLGDLYLKVKDTDRALKNYKKVQEINPANASIIVKIGDVALNSLQWEINSIKEDLIKDPKNADLKKQIKKLQIEKHKLSVIEFEKRVQSQPTVNNFKFDLAILYFKEKRSDEAIKLFQTTSKEPRYKSDSQIYLGKLFSLKEQYGLAIKQFDEALAVMTSFDAKKKEAIYNKADCLEKLGNTTEAKEVFQQIYVQDIDYKDVAKRVESL